MVKLGLSLLKRIRHLVVLRLQLCVLSLQILVQLLQLEILRGGLQRKLLGCGWYQVQAIIQIWFSNDKGFRRCGWRNMVDCFWMLVVVLDHWSQLVMTYWMGSMRNSPPVHSKLFIFYRMKYFNQIMQIINAILLMGTMGYLIQSKLVNLKQTHKSFFPQLPPFIEYCTENDRPWDLFSNCIFDIFDQNGDEEIQSGEWTNTVAGITGSQSIADYSLVVYYGIVAGTFEWRGVITEDDWADFMWLVREYLKLDVYVNGRKVNQTTTNTSNTTQLLQKNIMLVHFKGFLEQIKAAPKAYLRHQALGSYVCNNNHSWGILVDFLFHFFDLNNDGFIDQNELQQVGQASGIDVSQIIANWAEIDVNGDGKLDEKEWSWAMTYAKQYIEPQLNNVIPDINFETLLKHIF